MMRRPLLSDPNARTRAAEIAHTAGRLGATRVPEEAHAVIGPDPSDTTVHAILIAFEAGQLVRMSRQSDPGYQAAVAEELLQVPEAIINRGGVAVSNDHVHPIFRPILEAVAPKEEPRAADAEDTHFAAVICHGDSVPGQQNCGQVPLSESEYNRQMSRPDALWMCPCCGSTATFDDDYYEDRHGLNDEPGDPDGESFRGGEWTAAQATEMDWVRRNLK